MTKLEIKHYFLFFLSFFIFLISELPGASLILLLAWGQMAIYLWEKPLTKKIQIYALFHTLLHLPILVFLGSVLSFSAIYYKEGNYTFLISSVLISFIILYITLIYNIGFYIYHKTESSLSLIYSRILKNLKVTKIFYLKASIFFLFIIALNRPLSIDYSIILALIGTHLICKFMAKTLPQET